MIFIRQYVGDVTNKLLEKALPKEAFRKSFTKRSFTKRSFTLKAFFGKAFPKSLYLTPFVIIKWRYQNTR